MNKREFTLSDGKSDKFWNIEIDGSEFTVNYGKAGTSGQSQTKTFGDDETANKAADKLIAEKTKKGYAETSGSSAQTVAPTTTKTATKAVPKAKESGAETEVAADVATVSAAPIDWDAPRVIELEPHDWLWATWRAWTPLARPTEEPPAFDKAEALARLAKMPGRDAYSDWSWGKAKFGATIGRAEAHFWLQAMLTPLRYDWKNHKTIVQNEYLPAVAKRDYDGNLSFGEAQQKLAGKDAFNARLVDPRLVWLLAALFSPLQIVELFIGTEATLRARNRSGQQRYMDSNIARSFAGGFRQFVTPYLTVRERDEIRERLRPEIAAANWPADFYETPGIEFFLAAQIGMPDELLAVVRSWKDDLYWSGDSWHDHYHRPQEIVLGLGSAAEVEAQMRRLQLGLSSLDWIRGWLANTEFGAPDVVTQTIAGARGQNHPSATKEIAALLTEAFALARGPEIAPEMLRLLLESRGPKPARQWLDDNPSHAARGLVAVAGGRGKLAEAAIEQLRALKRRDEGAAAAIAVAAQTLPAAEAARVQSAVVEHEEKFYEPLADADTPAAIKAAIAGDKKLKGAQVGWISASDLPPLAMGDQRLNDEQVEALLAALKTPKHPLTLAVKSAVDRQSADAFAWKLFERWLGDGANSKEKWAFLALGELGGDAAALKLTPLIRAWPGESQHARAVIGLEVLRAIGSDTALMQINGIAQKIKFKGLQSRAVEAMEGIAQDRGFSRAQLEDRVVPTLDLDEHGTRVFDFGPRKFQVMLGDDIKPVVIEVGVAGAKPKPALPKPNASDDETLANAALADWKLLKKQLSEAVKINATRLESAMVSGRSWTVEEFELLIVKHPLMQLLARLLVWEIASGDRRATFRVTADGIYADQSDEPFDLTAGDWTHVGLVHPLNLRADEKTAWDKVMSNHEIVPPFAQLNRAIYGLQSDETGTEITRFADTAIAPETLNFGLEKLDWQVGGLHDHGDYYEHLKTFEAAGVRACAQYEPGLFKGWRDGWEPQKVVRLFFLPADYQSKTWDDSDAKAALPLSEVDAVAVSETLKDLSELAARGVGTS